VLLGQIARLRLPEWPAPPLALCRVDPNIRNFIRRPGDWASVDWENSGWGDPAFEIADLITHPSYAAVSPKRWDWLIAAYCAARDDSGAEWRIRVYTMLMLAWWAARLARTLYEVPRGGDQRLAPRSAAWQTETEALYQRYLALAQAATLEYAAKP
jgi:thiamine kinase-like enzyme